MADFYQTGVVTTLHRLDPGNHELIERELYEFSRTQRIALVLPALFSEFTRPAMSRIIKDLRYASYVHEIVVSLDRASEAEFDLARRAFAGLPQTVRVIWHDGPRLQALSDLLLEYDLPIGASGKGRGCWMAYGYVLAGRRIRSHRPARLRHHHLQQGAFGPAVLSGGQPPPGFRVCQGVLQPHQPQDARARDPPLHDARHPDPAIDRGTAAAARLSRQLPLCAGRRVCHEGGAGARQPRPVRLGPRSRRAGRGVRNCAPKRICQTELCGNYDHKHQEVVAGDPGRGLVRMCVDIAQILLRTLAAEGVVFTDGMFKTLLVQYIRTAEDMVNKYDADAAINGLHFDRHEEEAMVSAFSGGLRTACQRYQDDPLGVPLIPNWNRITSAIPDFLDRLRDAVDADNLMPVGREVAIA